MRQRVTLTEGQLRRIVEDASRMVIQEMIDEGWWDNFKNGATNAWNGFKDMNQRAFNNANNMWQTAKQRAGNMAQTASNFINLPMAAYNAYNAYRSRNAAPNAANGGMMPPMGGGYPTGSYPNAPKGGGGFWGNMANIMKNHPEYFKKNQQNTQSR